MLTHLSIKNIAVIDKAQIDFDSGFNILTGETGAGKSIIINSLNILKGERASKELIRSGEQSARVDGIFTVSDERKSEIEHLIGIDVDDNEIMISREFNLDGKNSVHLFADVNFRQFCRRIFICAVGEHKLCYAKFLQITRGCRLCHIVARVV